MPVRRLLAFGVDYLVITGYLLVLLAASVLALASGLRDAYTALWSTPGSAELSGFILLTLPVILYFGLFESSPAGATVGKRVLGIRVVNGDGLRLSLPRSVLRSALKLAPWELAHFTIWRYVYSSAAHHGPPAWTSATLAAVYILAAAYLASLFIGRSNRTIYDRIAGSRVIELIR